MENLLKEIKNLGKRDIGVNLFFLIFFTVNLSFGVYNNSGKTWDPLLIVSFIFIGLTLMLLANLIWAGISFLRTFNKSKKELEKLDAFSAYQKNKALKTYLISMCIVIACFCQGTSEILHGKIDLGIFNYLCGILIYCICNNKGNNDRKQVEKLVGEKSKALRDKLTIEGGAAKPQLLPE